MQSAEEKRKQKEDSKNDNGDDDAPYVKGKKDGDATKPEKAEKQVSKKQKKLMGRMKVFDLKMKVRRPDMVEAWDITTADPLFLMDMKMVRNSVPVPRHWSQKRRYLQYKRGVHKIPFKLPDFIETTGITKVREQANDKNKSLKQKMRERMQPKMGKIDIDYQILHDAFFKNQKKPKLTSHGDLYFEGKEYEIRMRGYKPGRMSPELRLALGIPENSPPPWLVNMQRYGPPPAYPNLKIPGVNAPIPESIAYGYGRLFTDEKGFTVYADCHGLNKAVYQRRQNRRPNWGQVKDVVEEEEESIDEEEEEEEEEEEPEFEGIGRNNLPDLDADDIYEEEEKLREEQSSYKERVNLDELKSGIASLIQGSSSVIAASKLDETASMRRPIRPPPTMPPLPTEARPLYEILPEVKQTGSAGSGQGEIYGSAHGYALPSAKPGAAPQIVQVNIQKNIEGAANVVSQSDKEKEDEKKKKEKKDKYKVKF